MKSLLALIILVTSVPAQGQTIFMVCGDLRGMRQGLHLFLNYYAAVDANYFEYIKEENKWRVFCEERDTSFGKWMRSRTACSVTEEGVTELSQRYTNSGNGWKTYLYRRLDFHNLRIYYSEEKYDKCEAGVVPKAWVERLEWERRMK